ncbi:hypothetical protein H9Q71_014515, partial [Fusarium xylarioides]
ETKVSIDRVEDFLREEETDKYIQLGLDNVDDEGVRRIGFNNATLTWGSKDTVAEDTASKGEPIAGEEPVVEKL